MLAEAGLDTSPARLVTTDRAAVAARASAFVVYRALVDGTLPSAFSTCS